MSIKDKPAKFYPRTDNLPARIVKNGQLICTFKGIPTNTQGHLMAKGLDLQVSIKWPEEMSTAHWDGAYDAYGDGYNAAIKACKEAVAQPSKGHTMQSVMAAICNIMHFPMLTSNQCAALAKELNK